MFPEPEYEFTKDLNDLDAYEKEAAEFVCEVNDPLAVVKWFREDKVRLKARPLDSGWPLTF